MVYYDVTRLLEWKRRPVGIVRVQSEFARLILTDRKYQHIRFIAQHYWFGFFYHVTNEEMRALLEEQNKTDIQVISAPPKNGEEEKKHLVADFLLAHHMEALLFNLRQIKHRLFMWYMQITALRGEKAKVAQVAWQQKDTVVSLDIDWTNRILPTLRKIKKKYSLRIVCTCYDLIPLTNPQFADEKNYIACFPFFVRDMLRVADEIMCISRDVEKDLLNYAKKIRVSPPPTQVVRLGDNVWHKPKNKEPHNKELRELIKNPYILFVSTLEVRKNHMVLLRAYEKLLEKCESGGAKKGGYSPDKCSADELPNLVLVGSLGWKIEGFLELLRQSPKLEQKIKIVSNLNDDDLSLAYQNCLLTVYPSFAEGWGLPVAESFAYGKFCICANTTSLPEVGGKFADYVAPNDEKGWAEKLNYYFAHPQKIKEKEMAIKKNYRVWTWEDFGEQVISSL